MPAELAEPSDRALFIDGYHSDVYKRYLTLFNLWCQQNGTTIHPTSSETALNLTSLQQTALVKEGDKEFRITFPRYASIRNQMQRLQREYDYLFANQLVTARSQEQLDGAIELLRKTHTHLLQLKWYSEFARSADKTDQEILAEQQAVAAAEADPIVRRRHSHQVHKTLLTLARITASLRQSVPPTGLVQALPQVELVSSSDPEFVRQEKNTKKTSKRKANTKEKFDQIKGNVLQLVINHSYPLNKFKFTKQEQCVEPFHKSKPYSISKADFVKTIESDPQLQEIFPRNYKRLSKEELCSLLFKAAKAIA